MNERASRTVPEMVGLVGFEPTASCTRGRRSTKLSHSPKATRRIYFAHFRKLGKEYRRGASEVAANLFPAALCLE